MFKIAFIIMALFCVFAYSQVKIGRRATYELPPKFEFKEKNYPEGRVVCGHLSIKTYRDDTDSRGNTPGSTSISCVFIEKKSN